MNDFFTRNGLCEPNFPSGCRNTKQLYNSFVISDSGKRM